MIIIENKPSFFFEGLFFFAFFKTCPHSMLRRKVNRLKKFEESIQIIGKSFAERILSSKIPYENIKEIVLNYGFPIEIYTRNGSTEIGKDKLCLSDIQEAFASVCEYSVHAYKDEICEGFVTAEGGLRVGICGTAVYENKNIIGIKNISGLNIRIPHEIKECSFEISEYANKGGILIIGPPCSGKTTLLRDLARYLGGLNKTVIVDERMEIAGVYRGKPCFDVGASLVLNGFLKSDGIKFASRSLAPDYIICDEFGDENDISSAVYAMKSGVKIIASIHALDKNDFLEKPFSDEIISKNIFSTFVFLNRNFEITGIFDKKGLFI